MYSRGSALSRYPTGSTATAALCNPSSYTSTTTASRRSNSTSVNARSTLAPAPSPPTQYSHQSQLRSLTEPPFATTLSGGSSLTRGRQPTSTLSALPSVEPQHASQRRSSSTMHSGSLYSRERARADEQEYEMENPVLSRFSTTSERQSNLQTDSYGRPVVAPPADRLDRGMPAIAPQVTSSATPQGFRNLGNTCYMNAALQCVLHSSGNLVRLLRAESRNSERSPRVTDALLQLMENPDFKALLAVKDYVSRMNAEFTGTRQNDSHEFTRELLYGIHKEVNRIRGKPKYIEMKDIDGEDDSAAALRWMDYLKTHDDSVIYDVFGGFLRSVTKCDNCGHRSLVFDPMLDLSVQVSSSVGQSLHVMNSMEEITILCCEKCKKKNLQGRRQTVVVKWPQCLMIHLKRFSASGRKDAEPVSYPLNITQGTISENCIVVPKGSTFPSRGYTLSGVVLHHGSMGFGHYTAMVRQGTKWYECDDSRVTAVSERQALSATSAGYILFYSQD